MQNTSSLYNEIISGDHWFETSLAIGDSGRLITESGDWIDFGVVLQNGQAVADTCEILVDRGGPETGYKEDVLMSLSTSHTVFSEDFPTVGGATAGEIDVEMLAPVAEVPRTARLVPYVRASDGERYSEWIQKGVYYIDTRSTTHNDDDLDILKFHGFDAMLKFEMNYPSDHINDYPLLDTAVVEFLADSIGVSVDPRTYERMDHGYLIPLPAGYGCREVLGVIAASYAGNFVMTDVGQLLLIRLNDLPKETSYTVTDAGYVIVWGEDSATGEPVRITI